MFCVFCLQRFGWGDRLSLPSTAASDVAAEYEEAFGVMETSLSAAAPSMSPILKSLIKQNRIEVGAERGADTPQLECPFEPSPLGIALKGYTFISPLTGAFLSFTYSPDAGAAGLAQFICKQAGQGV